MKRSLFSCLALLLVLSLLLCACGKNNTVNNTTSNNSTSSDTEAGADDTTVVATVNGTDIYYSEFVEQMATVEGMYGSLSDTLSGDEIKQKLNEQAKSVLENLIAQVILEQKAAEYGLTLTEEQEAAVAGAWEDVKARFTRTVQANYPTFTGEDLEAMVIMSLEQSGFKEDVVLESARASALISNLREHMNAEVSPATSAEIQALYDALLSEQKTEFENNPSAFEAAMLGSEVVVYIPADYRVIHEWEFRYDDENISLLKQMKEIDTEGSTAYEDVLSAEQGLLQQKVSAVRTRLSSGAAFDEVYAELNGGATPKANYISGATTRFSEEYTGAAMSIDTIGGVADTEVPLDFGCYLLCWADTLSEGTVDISEVSDALSAQILREKQNENWKTAQAQWRAEAEITIDEALIAY